MDADWIVGTVAIVALAMLSLLAGYLIGQVVGRLDERER